MKPDFVSAHSNWLLSLHYVSGIGPSALAEAHRRWDLEHAAPLRSTWRPFVNDRDPERPLRLGFVSSDFWRHPVGYLIVRALEGLRSLDCETYCYSTGSTHDHLTERIAAASDVWRPARGASDQELADRIRADRVDLLFDLAGHTSNHRLLVFGAGPRRSSSRGWDTRGPPVFPQSTTWSPTSSWCRPGAIGIVASA